MRCTWVFTVARLFVGLRIPLAGDRGSGWRVLVAAPVRGRGRSVERDNRLYGERISKLANITDRVTGHDREPGQ